MYIHISADMYNADMYRRQQTLPHATEPWQALPQIRGWPSSLKKKKKSEARMLASTSTNKRLVIFSEKK